MKSTAKKEIPGIVRWTKRLAMFLAATVFFIILAASYDFTDPYSLHNLVNSSVKALAAGLLFWFAGLIVCDIFLKGIVTDIPTDSSDLVDGGILQRIYLQQHNSDPDGVGNKVVIGMPVKSGGKANDKNEQAKSP